MKVARVGGLIYFLDISIVLLFTTSNRPLQNFVDFFPNSSHTPLQGSVPLSQLTRFIVSLHQINARLQYKALQAECLIYITFCLCRLHKEILLSLISILIQSTCCGAMNDCLEYGILDLDYIRSPPPQAPGYSSFARSEWTRNRNLVNMYPASNARQTRKCLGKLQAGARTCARKPCPTIWA